MKTKKLHCITDYKYYYKIFKNTLKTFEATPVQITQFEALNFENTHVPPYLELEMDWKNQVMALGEKNNILGDNGHVLIKQDEIHIPVVAATQNYLSFYKAYLIQPDEYIQFEEQPCPIWRLNISKNYVNKFLMSHEGGGFYLEYHHDVPHYHQNINGDGYYILGKANSDFSRIMLTAFKIPKNYAIYTSKGTIHCDAALTGQYLVSFVMSKNYSTVLLRQKKSPEKKVKVFFNEE